MVCMSKAISKRVMDMLRKGTCVAAKRYAPKPARNEVGTLNDLIICIYSRYIHYGFVPKLICVKLLTHGEDTLELYFVGTAKRRVR